MIPQPQSAIGNPQSAICNPQSADLSVDICGVRLPNPTVLASGILGLSDEVLARVARSGAGAVTTKSCSLKPRVGYAGPVVVDWGAGLINAVGLTNPGVEVMVAEIRAAREKLRPLGVPLIASIFARSVWDFGTIARYISEAEPDLIEVNISCPNVEEEFGRMFAASGYVAGQVVRRVKANTEVPIIVKLSPNVEDIADIAGEVEAAGADAISAINTLGPGLVLDIESARPVLSNRVGGVSGPAIRPIAVRCVHDICSVVNIPVIGLGGVTNGRDAIEMILVGATAVGLGSAVHYRGMGVFGQVCGEIRAYMEQHGYTSLADFRGKALEQITARPRTTSALRA